MTLKDRTVILVAEDDPGHAALIERNLRRAGIENPIIHFADGQSLLDYLFRRGGGLHRESDIAYVLLLDIKMPRVDGVEVLRQMKQDEELKKIPIIMLTTTDDPREVAQCHRLGCSVYLAKPIGYDQFVDAVQQLGLFLTKMEVPQIDGY